MSGPVSDPIVIVEVRRAGRRGMGLFAVRDLREGERILRTDLRGLPTYTVEEIGALEAETGVDGDHSDYAGHARYVVDMSPGSYTNHSCEPNCRYRHLSILVKDLLALRSIRAGEELTLDYAATSVDQFAGRGFWSFTCECGSPRCRGVVAGDLFALPLELQRRYWSDLPPSTRRRYRDRRPRP